MVGCAGNLKPQAGADTCGKNEHHQERAITSSTIKSMSNFARVPNHHTTSLHLSDCVLYYPGTGYTEQMKETLLYKHYLKDSPYVYTPYFFLSCCQFAPSICVLAVLVSMPSSFLTSCFVLTETLCLPPHLVIAVSD